jgi:hypothetical protein
MKTSKDVWKKLLTRALLQYDQLMTILKFRLPNPISEHETQLRKQTLISRSDEPVANHSFETSTATERTQPICPLTTRVSFHGACHSGLGASCSCDLINAKLSGTLNFVLSFTPVAARDASIEFNIGSSFVGGLIDCDLASGAASMAKTLPVEEPEISFCCGLCNNEDGAAAELSSGNIYSSNNLLLILMFLALQR